MIIVKDIFICICVWPMFNAYVNRLEVDDQIDKLQRKLSLDQSLNGIGPD